MGWTYRIFADTDTVFIIEYQDAKVKNRNLGVEKGITIKRENRSRTLQLEYYEPSLFYMRDLAVILEEFALKNV